MIAVTLFFKVILLQGDDGVDLPELTIIQLGFDALAFDGYESRFVKGREWCRNACSKVWGRKETGSRR